MTTFATTKNCRVCGAAFTVRAGAAGHTVNCPDHRASAVRKAADRAAAKVNCDRCGGTRVDPVKAGGVVSMPCQRCS